MDKNTIYRDVGFYILATLVILVFAILQEITTLYAIILILVYVAMVVVVKFKSIIYVKII